MTLKNIMADMRLTFDGGKTMFDNEDFEELQRRIFRLQLENALMQAEENYARTGIKHDGRAVFAELRAKYAKV